MTCGHDDSTINIVQIIIIIDYYYYRPGIIIIIILTYGRRAFSVAGPMFWNSLPDTCVTRHILMLFLDDY